MNPSVIVAGARTPIGRLMGGLSSVSCTELGGVAIRKALARAGVRGDQVDYVIVGQVLQAGTGQMTARQAAHAGGVPLRVPAVTINKVCLSGINAIAAADQFIRAGIHEIVLAGGMESMSGAPHLLPSSRRGQKYGDIPFVDSMSHDALTDSITGLNMGQLTERHNLGPFRVSREDQDSLAARSHQRAATSLTGHPSSTTRRAILIR